MNEYLMDVDDYMDRLNSNALDPDIFLEAFVETLLKWEDLSTGVKIIEAQGEQTFFELYENYVKGRGYTESPDDFWSNHASEKPVDFWRGLSRIEYALADDGNLHICDKLNRKYTIVNISNVEMIAFLVNRQIGVLENAKKQSAE
ncbi:MAG: hypothetical protein FWG10_09215 [Eubacteriaceae bacterium]|nr:hypothetical protein [Eubacteriaceae bacterium]